MLKLQLASKNVVKAAIVGENAEWVVRLMEGGGEWSQIVSVLRECADEGVCATGVYVPNQRTREESASDAIVVDEKMIICAAMTVRYLKSTNGQSGVLDTIQQLFEVLSSRYPTHLWTGDALLAVLKVVASSFPCRQADGDTLFKSMLRFVATAAPHLGKNQTKVAVEGLLSSTTNETFAPVAEKVDKRRKRKASADTEPLHGAECLFLQTLEKIEPPSDPILNFDSVPLLTQVLHSTVFASVSEWETYFPRSIIESGVSDIAQKLDCESATWQSLCTSPTVPADPPVTKSIQPFKKHQSFCLFEKVEASAHPLCARVVFEACAAALPTITSLRVFAVLCKICCAKDHRRTRLLSLHHLLMSLQGWYHFQTDIVYNSGLGFAVLRSVSDKLAKEVSVPDSNVSDEDLALVLNGAETLRKMYYKVVERNLKPFTSAALRACRSESSYVKAAKTFIQGCCAAYSDMQSFDTIADAIVDASLSLVPRCKEENDLVRNKGSILPGWLYEVVRHHHSLSIDTLPAASSAVTALHQHVARISNENKEVTGHQSIWKSQTTSGDETGVSNWNTVAKLSATSELLIAFAEGMRVSDTSAAGVAMWVDAVGKLVYAILRETMERAPGDFMLGSTHEYSPSHKKRKKSERTATALQQRPVVTCLLRVYHACQKLLDACSPCFLTNNIFKWANRNIKAFSLFEVGDDTEDELDESQVCFRRTALMSFPYVHAHFSVEAVAFDLVLFRRTSPASGEPVESKDDLIACLAGNPDTAQVVTELLLQKLMRISKYKAILTSAPADLVSNLPPSNVVREHQSQCAKMILQVSLATKTHDCADFSRVPALQNLSVIADACCGSKTSTKLLQQVLFEAATHFLHSQQGHDTLRLVNSHPITVGEEKDSLWEVGLLDANSFVHSAELALALRRTAFGSIITNDDTWETPILVSVLPEVLAKSLSSLGVNPPDTSIALVCLCIASFPSVVTSVDTLLTSLQAVDQVATQAVRPILRFTIAQLASRSQQWCATFARSTMEGWLAEAPSGGHLTYLATLRTCLTVLGTLPCSDAAVLCRRLLTPEEAGTAKHSNSAHPNSLIRVAAAAGSILARLFPARRHLPLSATDITDIRKKLRKLEISKASDSAQGQSELVHLLSEADAALSVCTLANGELLCSKEQPGSAGALAVAVGLKLLLYRRSRTLVVNNEILKISNFVVSSGREERRARSWLAAVALEIVLPILPRPQQMELCTGLIGAYLGKTPQKLAGDAGTTSSRFVLRRALQRVHKPNELDSVLFARLPVLGKSRAVVAKDVLEQARTAIDERFAGTTDDATLHSARAQHACHLLATFVLRCPTEFAISTADTVATTMTVVAAAHKWALFMGTEAFGRCSLDDLEIGNKLCALVSVLCLVEKLPLPPAALPLIASLPQALLQTPSPDSKSRLCSGSRGTFAPFEARFWVVQNLLQNIIIHRCGGYTAHETGSSLETQQMNPLIKGVNEWGHLIHALSDTLEGFLRWASYNASSVDEDGIDEDEILDAVVRLYELLAGVLRRPGVPVAVTSGLTQHGSILLQRFLASVVQFPTPLNIHSRSLARAFSAIVMVCGSQQAFALSYAHLPHACRSVAASFHLQWQSMRFSGKT
ncbi:hypothetical protein DIPPA_51958 [Diplonema papillatum]|nr:hypothetical protein DIPPA_51958 [Diplonema papillatum]